MLIKLKLGKSAWIEDECNNSAFECSWCGKKVEEFKRVFKPTTPDTHAQVNLGWVRGASGKFCSPMHFRAASNAQL